MPIPAVPATGPLSLRDDLWALSFGYCLTDPGANYNLYGAASGFGLPTTNDAMSNFYGQSCPASTVNLTFYSKQAVDGVGAGYYILYATVCSGKGANWDYFPSSVDCSTSSTCASYGTITVAQSTTIYIKVVDCNGVGIYFNVADNSSTCPANSATYCDDNTVSCYPSTYSFSSGTSNKNMAVTVYAGKIGYLSC
jgi:hypothetical protein